MNALISVGLKGCVQFKKEEEFEHGTQSLKKGPNEYDAVKMSLPRPRDRLPQQSRCTRGEIWECQIHHGDYAKFTI